MVVIVTSQLAASAGIDVAQLKIDFQNYKSGKEYDHEFFGKDSLCINSTVLHHVHIIPTDLVEFNRWIFNFEHYRKCTSDRFLYYSCGPGGYLLIDIVNDPGGHASLKNKEVMANLELVAAHFAIYGTIY
jgi:hypothetical protein